MFPQITFQQANVLGGGGGGGRMSIWIVCWNIHQAVDITEIWGDGAEILDTFG